MNPAEMDLLLSGKTPDELAHQRRLKAPYALGMDSSLIETIELLKPAELFPAWRYVDRLEQLGDMTEFEARRWKYEIFSVMLERGLEPDGLVGIFEGPVPVF